MKSAVDGFVFVQRPWEETRRGRVWLAEPFSPGCRGALRNRAVRLLEEPPASCAAELLWPGTASCRAVLGWAAPCHAVPCRAMLYHAVPGCSVPCCTMPCRAAAPRSRGAGCAVAGLGQDSSPAASHPEVLQRSKASACSGRAACKPRPGFFAVWRWAVGRRGAERYQGPAAPYCQRFIHPPVALSLLSDRCCLSWQESGGGAVSWLAVRRGDIAPLPPGLLR